MDSVSTATSLLSAGRSATQEQLAMKMIKTNLQAQANVASMLEQGAATARRDGMGGALDITV